MRKLTNNKRTSVTSTLRMVSMVMLLNSVSCMAAALDGQNAFYLNVSGNVAVGKDNEESVELYRHGGGFHLSEMVDIGVADVYLKNEDGAASTRGAEFYLRRMIPVSELAQLYVNAGATTFGDHFSMGGGMLYATSDHFDIDVGYRYYAGASEAQGDTYSFGVGLQYNFSDRAISVMQAPQTPSVQPRSVEQRVPEVMKPEPKVAEPALKVPATESSTSPICAKIWRSSSRFVIDPQHTTSRYEVQEGDWAILIAHRHCTTLDVLVALNPWLSPRVVHNRYIYPGEELIVPNLSE